MYNFKKKSFISSMNQNTIYKFISITLAFFMVLPRACPKIVIYSC